MRISFILLFLTFMLKGKIQLNIFFTLFLFTITFLSFGVYHLGKFHTADEDLWFANPTTGRVHTYWNALLSGNWEETRINDKPGITTAIISGSIGLLFDTHPEDKVLQQDKYSRASDPALNEYTAFYFRLPILLVNALLILCLFFLTQKYTQNNKVALIFSLFLFFSPILLGISQVVNPDSTLWSFTFVSLLSWLLFLKENSRRYFILATIATGLALLSKYTTLFLLVFTLFISLSHALFFLKKNSRELFRREARRIAIFYPLYLLGACIIFVCCMPATLLHPSYLYLGTLGFDNSRHIEEFSVFLLCISLLFYVDTYALKNFFLWNISCLLKKIYPHLFLLISIFLFALFLFTTVNWTLGNIFDLSSIPFDQARGEKFQDLSTIKQFVFETRPLLFTLIPITLFFVFWELWLCIRHFKQKSTSLMHFSILAFLLLFYLAVLLQNLLVDVRYSIILYPAILLFASFGAFSAFTFLSNTLRIPRKNIFLGFFATLIILNILSLWNSKPFYFNYTNILLPQENSITTAWGYGGYEAAHYLNSLPDARNLTAWTDYEGFCPFFLGHCIKGSRVDRYDAIQNIDYFITTRRGMQIQKGTWGYLKKNSAIESDPIWSLFILDRKSNFVKIYKKQTPAVINPQQLPTSETEKEHT